jgi:spore coat polysaccharide biosynthesis protein SpsF
VVDEVVSFYLKGEYDYVSNAHPPTFPDGLDTEVFSFAALERAWHEARLRSEHEHVTPYIREHPEIFRAGNLTHKEDLSGLRWTVDEPQDLEFVCTVFKRLGTSCGLAEVLSLLQKCPELLSLNTSIQRDKGYLKSLSEDGLLPRK